MRPSLSLLGLRLPSPLAGLVALGLLGACAAGQAPATDDTGSTGSNVTSGGGSSASGPGGPGVSTGQGNVGGGQAGSGAGSQGSGDLLTTTGGGSTFDFENQPPCDGALALDSTDPMDALRAMDICKVKDPANAGDWGVVSAAWVLADGTPAPNTPAFHMGHGVLGDFGPNMKPKGGSQLLVLSSGTARRPGDPGYNSTKDSYTKGLTSGNPPGFPKPSCGGASSTGMPNDIAGVEAVIRTPPGAQGLAFDFSFYTDEWPLYVCDRYNDVFVALLGATQANFNQPENIAFDTSGNPICVNNAFISVCGCPTNQEIAFSQDMSVGIRQGPPCVITKYRMGSQDEETTFQCPGGSGQLQGTGFANSLRGGYSEHGSTGWLQTNAPVPENSEIRLRLAVYDAQDPYLDSSVVLDHFRWVGVPVSTETVQIQ